MTHAAKLTPQQFDLLRRRLLNDRAPIDDQEARDELVSSGLLRSAAFGLVVSAEGFRRYLEERERHLVRDEEL
jgi:hypothetical protein